MMKIKAFEKSDVVYITQTETAGITSGIINTLLS